MSPQMLAYPFLFIAIFFESFILVTLLSAPARAARKRVPACATDASLPSVAVIVPCLNEGETVAGTTVSLLALDYPKDKLEIILVDNGSTDNTPEVMARFKDNPQVRILTVTERGKHVAVNAGIATTSADFIGCLDADSFVEPSALYEIIPCFEDPQVASVTAAMSVFKPKNLLEHMQNAEYTFGITMRHVFASINGLYVTPGPFSFYRHTTINELGGFRHGHATEDMEMALRIQQAGYRIENAVLARVYTKAPNTLPKLVKQRTRWTTGFMRNVLGEYRGLIGNRANSALGLLVLPSAVIAIGSSMLLFGLAIFELVQRVSTAVQVRIGIPLQYSLVPQFSGSFDWFYFPTSFYILLGVAVLIAALSMIVIGKRLSKTPGPLTIGLVAYTFLYGLIAPLWLIRATSDVARGKHRNWRPQ
jgi:cellulose synthase/poly-beta-1,6-N-acetylglucosamine synthase-like glycosyltransferase